MTMTMTTAMPTRTMTSNNELFHSVRLVSALSKLAEEMPASTGLAKHYHPDVLEHFKRRLKKGRDEALEAFSDFHTKKQPVINL